MTPAEAKSILLRKLDGLTLVDHFPSYMSFQTVGSNLTRHQGLPLPWLVYMTLVEILGYQCYWRIWEKTLWTVPALYKGTYVLLEHGKFGLRVGVSGSCPEGLVDDLLGQLSSCFSITRRVFAPVAAEKIRSGAVTLPNQWHSHRGRYNYFRERATEEFCSDPSQPIPFVTAAGHSGSTRDLLRPQRQGYYFASAALDAYFSALEHVLTLLGPFYGIRPPAHDILDFCSLRWSSKYKKIFNFTDVPEAHRTYDALVHVKRSFRNPIAHGGVDREGHFMYVHFPKLGALPAQLDLNQRVSLFPIQQTTFEELCATLDSADKFLASGPTKNALRFIEGGFDVAFDASSLKLYDDVTAADEELLQEILDRHAYMVDRVINMEW